MTSMTDDEMLADFKARIYCLNTKHGMGFHNIGKIWGRRKDDSYAHKTLYQKKSMRGPLAKKYYHQLVAWMEKKALS